MVDSGFVFASIGPHAFLAPESKTRRTGRASVLIDITVFAIGVTRYAFVPKDNVTVLFGIL